MQGPVDDAVNTNMVTLQLDEDCDSYSKNLKSGLVAESGICNVCSAPCSSCFHINKHFVGSKTDECSGETCNESALSFCINDAVQIDMIEDFDKQQMRQMHNSVSGTSSNTSETVDCEASLKNSNMSTAFEDVLLTNFDNLGVEKGSGHSVAGDTGMKEAKLSDSSYRDGDRTGLNNNPGFGSSLEPQKNGQKVIHLDLGCYVDENQNNPVRELKNTEVSLDQGSLPMHSQTDASVHNSGTMGASSKNAGDATLLEAVGSLPQSSRGMSLSCDPIAKDFQENQCPRLNGVMLASSSKHLNSLSVEVISEVVNKDSAVDSLYCEENNACIDKLVGTVPLPVAKDDTLESNLMEESDDSDMVEHDVKVCDICGDAGREELLAICCSCSDGAEHTYCMREMLDKVPEGHWLCEECKAGTETNNKKQGAVGTAGSDNKIYSSGQVNPENVNLFKNFETELSDVEGIGSSKGPSGVKVSGKRHLEDVEVSSATKRHTLDHDVGPENMLASNSLAALSHGSSFKNIDRGNARPTQHSSPCTNSAPELVDSPTLTSMLQTPRGTFSKSNSFSSLYTKTKVKLVADVVPQKQRSVRGHVSLSKKEGATRQICKSMSFKFANSTHPNGSESKLKMLSPKFSPCQDIKGSKHTKDGSLFERKNSFNKERPSVSSPLATSGVFAAKNGKRIEPSTEPNPLSSLRSCQDSKAPHSDTKPMTFSRSSSFISRKASEMPISFGESKRQSSQFTSLIRVSSTSEISHDVKSNLSSPKEDSTRSCVAEQPPCNANEDLQDGLSRPQESTTICERGKEISVSQSKQSCTIGGRNVSCHKCKEFGHLAQFCKADCPGSPTSDASASKSLREMTDCKDKLKAAIEAAVLRKPGIYRKHRVSDQCDDISALSLNSEISSQKIVVNSGNRGIMSSSEEPEHIQGSYMADFKQATVNNIKQAAALHVEASSSNASSTCPVIPDEGLINIDVPLILKTLAIPDQDCIWQGSFEVCCSETYLNLCDGIQAHLSSCASPKVLEAVNKFPHKILLNEVPRLTTWPVQFKDYGVKEDNIALFFFARDLSSYEKSYKILLDNMMKNDLALKGNLNAIELMIFPSNQLPEKSQRWNTLFFLWGVFRGKRSDCSEHVSGSQKQISVSQDNPTAIMTLPKNKCSVTPADKDLPKRKVVGSASEVPVLKVLPCLSCAQTWNGDCDTKLSSQVLPSYSTEAIAEKQDHRHDTRCFLVVESGSKSCEDAVHRSMSSEDPTHINPFLDGCIEPDDKLKPKQCVHTEANRRTSYNGSVQLPMQKNFNLNGHYSSNQFDEYDHGRASLRSMDESNKTDLAADGSEQETPCCQAVKDNPRKRRIVDSVVSISEAASPGTSEAPSHSCKDALLEEISSKKLKTDFCAFDGGNDQTNSQIEGFVSTVHGFSAGSSSTEADGRHEVSDRSDLLVCAGNAERYLFPFQAHNGVGQDRKSTAWRINPVEENRLLDSAPNLELALGAETKPSSQGIPPFLVGKEDKISIEDHCVHDATKREEDDVSASLSLSLSFPFSEEQ